jgi:ABC-type transporter Mla subunit MlaD
MTTSEVQWLGAEIATLGVVKDPKACSDFQLAVVGLQNAKGGLQQNLTDVNAAILNASQAGADTSGLMATRQEILNALGAVNAQIADAKKGVDNYCAEVEPGPPPAPECSATNPCPAGNDCVDGKCVPKPAPAPTAKKTNWGLAVLGLAAAVGLGLAFAGLRKNLPAQPGRTRDNPCPCGPMGCRC